MSKKVNYNNKLYKVPDWAKFIATDGNQEVYAYEERPVYGCVNEVWVSVSGKVEQIEPLYEDTIDPETSLHNI